MVGMTYEEARAVIQDGDVVFVHGSWTNPFSAAVMLFTASPLSHVCIAFWVEAPHGKLLLCVEAQNRTRRRILPLSLYSGNQLTVVAAPDAWNNVKDRALEGVGRNEYGLLEAAYVGLREFVYRHTKYKLPLWSGSNEFCSAFVANTYGLACVDVSPQMLYEQLLHHTTIRGLHTGERDSLGIT